VKLIYRQTSRRALIIGSIILAPLLLLLGAFEWGVVQSSVVTSASMSPTLLVDDRVIVDSRSGYRPQTGDIVTFSNPAEPDGLPLVKRVIGLEGDTIAVREGRLYRNDEPWPGPIHLEDGERIKVRDMEITVPPGRFFAAGDNINQSFDSFQFGSVPLESIQGRVRLLYWPSDRFAPVGRFSAGT